MSKSKSKFDESFDLAMSAAGQLQKERASARKSRESAQIAEGLLWEIHEGAWYPAHTVRTGEDDVMAAFKTQEEAMDFARKLRIKNPRLSLFVRKKALGV